MLRRFRVRLLPTSSAILFALPLQLNAETDMSKIGRLAYIAWNCAALASIAEERNSEFERLFLVGYDNATKFLSAAIRGDITEEVSSKVPIGLMLNLTGGPTPEFQLGALWARIELDAYQDHWPKDLNAPFDELKEVQRYSAGTAFVQGSCEVIQ